MSMRKLVVVFSLSISLVALAQESPRLGERVTAAEIEARDFAILPNGDGLPAGAGTALDGAEVYRTYCFACHGEKGRDGINDPLAGGHGSLTSARPVKTLGSFWPYATTIFDYVRRAMPLQTPGVLTNDQLYAVTAYLLFVNDVITEDEVIDASSLPEIHMPNRDNFVWDYAPTK